MRKRSPVVIFALASAALLAASCDRGPTQAERSSTEKQSRELCPIESPDKIRAVFQYLHRANENEIRLGNLAGDRTQFPDIKHFATQMVSEHAAADQKLVDLARRENIDLTPIAPVDPIHAADLRLGVDEEQTMQTVSSDAFDLAYLASQAGHHALLVKISDEGQKVAGGDVKSLLENAREMASRHHGHALVLMQDFRFVPRAIGGGPRSVTPGERTPDLP
jgi:putative membrane protein